MSTEGSGATRSNYIFTTDDAVMKSKDLEVLTQPKMDDAREELGHYIKSAPNDLLKKGQTVEKSNPVIYNLHTLRIVSLILSEEIRSPISLA